MSLRVWISSVYFLNNPLQSELGSTRNNDPLELFGGVGTKPAHVNIVGKHRGSRGTVLLYAAKRLAFHDWSTGASLIASLSRGNKLKNQVSSSPSHRIPNRR